jgi:hypothetical protein
MGGTMSAMFTAPINPACATLLLAAPIDFETQDSLLNV